MNMSSAIIGFMSKVPSQERVLEIFWGGQKVISTDHATYPRQVYERLNRMIGGPDRDIPVGFFV